MSDMAVVYTMLFMGMAFVLMTFALFVIGFLLGYKKEDRKILEKKHQDKNNEALESDREKKAKKEWKKFLEYDGSAPELRE